MRLSRCWALLVLLPTVASARTWTVDDDRLQCRGAEFSRIQDAVDAASPGDRIHVCSGLYVESVTVDKPLTLKGSGPGLATLRTGDPRTESVVRPPAGGNGITILASATQVSLFTVWGQQDGVLPDIGIQTGPDSSDDDIELNAIWDFHDGIELQSNNLRGDTVFGNALRGPGGAAFNGLFGIHLLAIRAETVVAANVLRHYPIGIEADPGEFVTTPPIGPLKIDLNDIADTWDAIELRTAVDCEIALNRASVDRSGIFVSDSARVSVTANALVATGINDFGIGPGILVSDTSDFAVLGNDVREFTTANLFNAAAITFVRATSGKIERNRVHHVLDGHGIALTFTSSGNLVKGNSTDHASRDGLLVEAGSTGNTMLENTSFLNGQFDADDRNRSADLWCRTRCQKDNPPGTICFTSDPGCP